MIERRGNILYFDQSDSKEAVDAACAAIRAESDGPTTPIQYWARIDWTPRFLSSTLRAFQPRPR